MPDTAHARTLHPLFQRLDLTLPIVQAPMVGVSTPALAAAVSNAGALGNLGLGASNVEGARKLIAATRALTSRPFGVNFFCHRTPEPDPAGDRAWLQYMAPLFAEAGIPVPDTLAPGYGSFTDGDEMLALLLEERPAVVSFHFGLPQPGQIQALKAAGICLMGCATTLEEAQAIEAAGLDAVIAQGIEAGGHRGRFDAEAGINTPDDEQLSTAVLVHLLSRHIRLPIIAAGGIMDGQGIRAMLALGAAAAQLGTAFILCPESSAPEGYRARLQSADAAHTRLSAGLSGRAARGMVNRIIAYTTQPDTPAPAAYPRAYDAAKQLNMAAAPRGDHRFAAHWAGQGAPLARAMPAAELVATLAQELQAC